MTELKIEHVLMLAIVAFMLYHLLGSCGCRGNGFSVGVDSCKVTKDGDQRQDVDYCNLNGYFETNDPDAMRQRAKDKDKDGNIVLTNDDVKDLCSENYYQYNLAPWKSNYLCDGDTTMKKNPVTGENFISCAKGTKCS